MRLRDGWRIDTSVLGVGPGQACVRSAKGWAHRWRQDGSCFYGLTGETHARGKASSLTTAMQAVERAHDNQARRRRAARQRRAG